MDNKLEEIKGSRFLSTKNFCIFLGVVFGSLGVVDGLYVIPSSILLILGGIQYFEYTKKNKKYIEHVLKENLDNLDKEIILLKQEIEKNKIELNTLKNRVNFSQINGMK